MKPALVQCSARLDELPAGPARRGRGAAPAAQEHERGRERRRARARSRRSAASRYPAGAGRSRSARSSATARDRRAGRTAGPERGRARRRRARGRRPRPHQSRGLLGVGHGLAARRAEQDEARHLDEAEHGERRRRRQRAERDRAGHAVGDVAVRGDVQQRLQRQPLRGEAVQRRQARDRHRADEEGGAGPRHPPQEAAEPVDLERADRALERAGAQEEERLEDGVVHGVQERRPERERRPLVGAAGAQQQAGADAEHDDPDVLDRVQRQQALEVVLEERVDHAADRRERADGEHEQRRTRPAGTPTQSTSTRTSP